MAMCKNTKSSSDEKQLDEEEDEFCRLVQPRHAHGKSSFSRLVTLSSSCRLDSRNGGEKENERENEAFVGPQASGQLLWNTEANV